MRIKAGTRVRKMLRAYPQLEDVLGWHDIEVDDDVQSMSLRKVCLELGLDLDELLDDIQASLRDSAGDGWPVDEDLDDDEGDDDDEDDYYDEDDDDGEDGGFGLTYEDAADEEDDDGLVEEGGEEEDWD
ncbi:MAG: hypothetical protein AAFV53_01500 [Myxococcota bacterium]